MNNQGNSNNNENNASSKKGLIAGLVVLAVVIGLAVFFYNRGSDIKTGAGEKAVEEIAKAKENADKYAEADKTNDKDTNADSTDNSDNGESDSAKEDEPIVAPDFIVYTKDNEAVRFSDKIGKPMIINFWATWCGPCKMEMPYFEEAYKQYGDKIEFMMINPTDGANDTHESVDKFLADTGYTFPVYRDTERSAGSAYGIRAFPTTVLVNKDGYFIGGYEGTMNEEMLDALIELLLS